LRWGIVGYSTAGAGAESAPDSTASACRGTGRRKASQGSTRGGPPTPTEPSPLHESGPFTAKKRSENPTEARTNPNATDYTLEVRLQDFGVAIPASLDRNRRDHDVHAITRGETCIAAPGRATGGRGRTRPTEPQAERSRAQRPGPDLPWPFRATSGLRRNRVAPGRSNAESGATLFPVPARARVPGTIACRDTIAAVATHTPHWLRFMGASLDRLAREPRFRSFAASALLQN
jgi:hypothetical protein